jgi:uncharacterized protein YqeY
MTLTERIQSDLTQAMKAKDELRLSVLRMMKSAIKNKEIEKIRPLDDAESLQVLNTLVKQRRESVEMFAKGGRKDLVDKETKEIAIIETYLPAGGERRRYGCRDCGGYHRDRSEFAEANGRGDQGGARAP